MNSTKKWALGFVMCLACAGVLLSPAGLAQEGSQPKQPQAKTKAEYDAYLALFNEQDLTKKVDLAAKFIAEYPASELKPAAYQMQVDSYFNLNQAAKVVESGEKFMQEYPEAEPATKKFVLLKMMSSYQRLNNFEKTVDTGDQILAIDANDLAALLTLSSVLPERLPPDDEAKRSTQLDKAMDIAKRAMEEVNKLISGPKPAAISDQQWADEKNRLQASVNSAIGLVHLNKKEYQPAQEYYEKATSLARNNPVDFFRLGYIYAIEARNVGKELNDMIAALQNQQNPDQAAADAAKEKEKVFNELRDKAIDAYAKSVALKGVTEQQANSELEKLWKNKNDSLEGLPDFIAQAKAQLEQPVQ
ncbi:MAG: hypothetical protein AB1898_28995 [Acidobacteriota bacterium]